MKRNKTNNIKIFQDSKTLPFSIYKRIAQTGDFLYMVKGYEPGDNVKVDKEHLKDKFNEIEEDYATSMNTKNSEVLMYGEIATVTNEFNKYNILLLFIDEAIKCTELRLKLQDQLSEMVVQLIEEESFEEANEVINLMEESYPEKSEFTNVQIKELLKDFKVQKSDDLYQQRQLIQNKLDKLNNQLEKLKSQLKKKDGDQENAEFDIEEQFVSVCLGLEIPVDDTKITLYQYGLMVKALIKRVEELNKLNSHAR